MGDLDRELRRTLSALAEASPGKPVLDQPAGRGFPLWPLAAAAAAVVLVITVPLVWRSFDASDGIVDGSGPDGSITADTTTPDTVADGSSGESGIDALRGLHALVVETGGAVLDATVIQEESQLEGAHTLLFDVDGVVWAADPERWTGEQRFTIGSNAAEVAADAEGMRVLIAVDGDREVQSVGRYDDTGTFLRWSTSGNGWSTALGRGGTELYRTGYQPWRNDVCETTPDATYASPVDAVRTYFATLGATTEDVLDLDDAALLSEAESIAASPDGTVDPVTGLTMTPNITAIYNNLVASGGTDRTPISGIPVQIVLADDPSTNAGDVMVFLDVASGSILGWFNPAQHVTDGDGSPVAAVIHEIAPPTPDGRVTVVLRTESVAATKCGRAMADDRVMLDLSAEEIAGPTRVSIDVNDFTYRTFTGAPTVVPAPPLVTTIWLSVDPTEVVLGDSVRISGVAEPASVEGARSLTSVYLIRAPTATLVDELCRMRIATDGVFSCTALIEEGGRFSSVTPGTYWIAVGDPWNVVRGTELTVREISS